MRVHKLYQPLDDLLENRIFRKLPFPLRGKFEKNERDNAECGYVINDVIIIVECGVNCGDT